MIAVRKRIELGYMGRVMSIDLSIVIPLYNEEENVQLLFDELKGVLEKMGKSYEVVLIDDGSKDKTFEKLTAIAEADERVVVLRFRRNFGQTAALSAGIERAKGQVIVPMDGDLQNDPADIPRLLEKMGEGYECVSGWRKARKDAGARVLPSKVANWLIARLSGVYIHDYGCTMKAYTREVIEGVRLYGEMHRFVPIYAHWQGARVTEMVTNHRERRFGKSKYGFERIFKVVLDLMVVKFLFSYLSKPIYVFGGFGMASIALSLLAFGIATYWKFAHIRDYVTTPLPLFAGIAGLVGVQSILVGLLAEVVVRTYYESQDKRPYVVGTVIEQRKLTRS